MKDLKIDDTGDWVIDPDTHDFAMVDGVDEVVQRIKATLSIRYGEMVNIAPEIGSDYSSFFGKNINVNNAISDMQASITSQVPEVESIKDFKFEKLKDRKLKVTFTAFIKVSDTTEEREIGEVYSLE